MNIIFIQEFCEFYDIYEKDEIGFKITLNKTISRTDDKLINIENILTVKSDTKTVSFENIDSHYLNKLGAEVLICPKGKFHPYDFYEDKSIIPNNFEEIEYWDLRCYFHDTGYFFVIYSYSEKENCFYSYNNNDLEKFEMYKYNLYDFILENGINSYNDIYKSASVHNYYDAITLIYNEFTLSSNTINRNTLKRQVVTQAGIYSSGSFDVNNYLYFFTYNTISDFKSGYSTQNLNLNDISNTYSLLIIINDTNPLYFCENSEIESINFVQGTKYLYYSIKRNFKKYFGIIDIKLNKILFNSDELLITFLPYSSNIMLSITDSSAFILKINTTCDLSWEEFYNLDKMTSNMISETKSYINLGNKVKLMPFGIYIDKDNCDLNFYILNEEECGLCNYFNPDKIYKFNNSSNCLKNIPENAEIYNQTFNLIRCKENYYEKNDTCVFKGCYQACDLCFEYSTKENNQKCKSCKEGFIFDNGNCIKEEIIIYDENLCTICDVTCKNCDINICKCISCSEGYYLDNYTCHKCVQLCKEYKENSCLCKEEKSFYSFYGHYKEINEKIFILKENNLTNVDNKILDKIRYK